MLLQVKRNESKSIIYVFRCSPNVAHFEVAEFPSAFANLPLCRDYCDRWYEACKDESTCAVNWITDWDYDSATGENNCKVNSTCQRYRYKE